MRMREVDAIALPTGKAVELKPGGLHIMFIGLKAPLKAGESFPLKLRFEKAGEVTVQVNVEAAGAAHEMKH
jgi:periplasmic copper chaperone A